jgi:hypothetical protein
LIRTPVEPGFKHSSTPACHGPPDTWPVAMDDARRCV